MSAALNERGPARREGRPRRPAADKVTAVKPAASEAHGTDQHGVRRAAGTRLLLAGVIAFTAAVVSWLVFNAVNGGLNEVDLDRKSTRLNSSHGGISRMPSSA